MITQCKRCGFKNYDPYLRLPSCGHCHQDPYTKAPEVPFVEREGHLEEVARRKGQLLAKMATLRARQSGTTRAQTNYSKWIDGLNEQIDRGIEKHSAKRSGTFFIPQRVYSDGMHPNYVDGDFRLRVERSVNRHMFEFIVNHGRYSHMEAIPADAVFAARKEHHGMEDLCAYVVNQLRTYIEGEKP